VVVKNAEPKPELKLPKKKIRKMSRCTKNQQKVLILGDSHARGCAQEIQHNLNCNFSVQGIVKPGACMKDIVSSPPTVLKIFPLRVWLSSGAVLVISLKMNQLRH
jgi:hypothetical protein